ncbi:MAG: hypothetical protein WBS54_14980 [Acidobacteriota bacterium]
MVSAMDEPRAGISDGRTPERQDEVEGQPSPLGVLLWPPDGFYRGIPCTCTGEEPCKGVLCNGECGCRACTAAAADNSRVAGTTQG